MAGKRYKIIGSAVACCVIQYLFAGFRLGWQALLLYPKAIALAETQINQGAFGVLPEQEACLRGFLSHFIPAEASFCLASVLMLISLYLLFCLWRRVNDKREESIYVCFSLTILVALLLSPHLFLYDLLLLAIPAALSLKTLNPMAIAKYACSTERILSYSLLAYPALGVLGLIATTLSFGNTATDLGFFFLHCLILALVLCNLSVVLGGNFIQYFLDHSRVSVRRGARSLSLLPQCASYHLHLRHFINLAKHMSSTQ